MFGYVDGHRYLFLRCKHCLLSNSLRSSQLESILDAAKDSGERVFELRSGVLLNMAPCWDERKGRWRKDYCDPDELRRSLGRKAPSTSSSTPVKSPTTSTLSSPSPLKGSSLSAYDVDWVKEPVPHLFLFKEEKHRLPPKNVLAATAVVSSSQPRQGARSHSKRATPQMKFDGIRERVRLAMECFGEGLKIDEVVER